VQQYDGSGLQTWTVSDAVNGTYTLHENLLLVLSTRLAAVLGSKRNVTGGFSTVTLNSMASSADWVTDMYEVSGLDNALAVTSSNHSDSGTGMSSPCGDSGLTGTGFIFCISLFTDGNFLVDGGATTPPSGWTNDSISTSVLATRHISTFSSEVGTFTTANAVQTYSAIALFKTAAAGPCLLSLLGVGRC
jgi:hypothetical protein